jgi:hypothetical protein
MSCSKALESLTIPSGNNLGQDSSPTTYARWSSNNPMLAMKIAQDSTSFSVNAANLIESMGNVWEAGANNSDFFHFGRTSNLEYSDPLDYLDGEMGIYYLNSWFDPAQYAEHGISQNAIAVTQYFGYRRGSLLDLAHADIMVNGHFFFSTSNSTPSGQYDLPSVMLHELGHVVGMAHNSIEFSVMRPRISSGNYSYLRVLQSADIRDIRSLYGLSSRSNVSAMTTQGEDLVRGIFQFLDDGTIVQTETAL